MYGVVGVVARGLREAGTMVRARVAGNGGDRAHASEFGGTNELSWAPRWWSRIRRVFLP